MTRIAELEKKYPDVSRDIIVKWEIMVNDLRDSFGSWMSEVVPYEANWVAQLLDSAKSRENTQKEVGGE